MTAANTWRLRATPENPGRSLSRSIPRAVVEDANRPADRVPAALGCDTGAMRIRRSLVQGTKRFFAIDGLDLGSLVAIELFTTVLPILLLAYAWSQHFHTFSKVGQLFVSELQVGGEQAAEILHEFGTAAELHHVWTVAGVLGFLAWGIPMSLTVGRAFSLAWQRPMHTVLSRIWRGTVWFLLYLCSALLNHRAFIVDNDALMVVALVPALTISVLFWGASPVLLVKDFRWQWRSVLIAGVPGAIVMALMRGIVAGIVVPLLLSGWDGFGPIGVAFTLMTWCGVNGVAWVAIACLGAVLIEPDGPVDPVPAVVVNSL